MSQIVGTFQAFRRVLCLCPHCNSIKRLSDLHLRYQGVGPRTWLDTFETRVSALTRKEELFDDKEKKLRDEATERGRRRVPALVRKSMDSQFAKMKYNPYDIKALLHPVDFVVFDGLESKNKLRQIVFLSKTAESDWLTGLRNSVHEVVDQKNYNWQVARVSVDGKIEITDK